MSSLYQPLMDSNYDAFGVWMSEREERAGAQAAAADPFAAAPVVPGADPFAPMAADPFAVPASDAFAPAEPDPFAAIAAAASTAPTAPDVFAQAEPFVPEPEAFTVPPRRPGAPSVDPIEELAAAQRAAERAANTAADPQMISGRVSSASASVMDTTDAESDSQNMAADIGERDREIVGRLWLRLLEWEKQERDRRHTDELPENEVRERIDELATHSQAEAMAPPQAIARALRAKRSNIGGLERYLEMPGVADIMINSFDRVYLEDAGEMIQVRSPFAKPSDLREVIDTIGRLTGRGRPTFDKPTLDGRFDFAAGTGTVTVRASVALDRLTGSGNPVVTLRKPVASGFDRLSKWSDGWSHETPFGAPLTPGVATFVREALRRKANLLIVGGTGSGKTSLMKAILREIDPRDRVITVEDSPELLLGNPNSIPIVADGDYSIDKLIQVCMRMRPDRIIVGECRKGGEVMGFVQAVNTGHDGSITTTHASSAVDGIQRLLTLAARDGGDKSSEDQVAKLIASGIDMVVFIGSRQMVQPDGSLRRVRRLMEVVLIDRVSLDKGTPEFVVSSLFGRYIGDSAMSDMTDITRPLVCRGFGRVPQRFKDRMAGNGWTEEAMRELIEEAMTENPEDASVGTGGRRFDGGGR